MAFPRLRRPKPPAQGLVSCFGKLPFHEEYLRVALDSPAATELAELLDEAHHLIVAADGPREDGPELRIHVALDGGETTACLLVRHSGDAKGRRYPISLFTFQDTRPLLAAWHLMPVWTAPAWQQLSDTAFASAFDSPDTFAGALTAATCVLEPAAPLAERFDAFTAAAVANPWAALVGAAPPAATQWARKLAQVADVVQETGNPDHLALWVPLSQQDPTQLALAVPLRLALWVRVLSAWLGVPRPWPALVESIDARDGTPRAAGFFSRPLTATDLAWFLAGVGDSPLEDLSEPWEKVPLSDRSQQAMGGLVDLSMGPFASLWSREP